MPGITMMRPQNEVHVVRLPPGVHPKRSPKSDPRDKVVFDREDQQFFHVEKILGAGAFGMAARVRVLKSDEKFRKGELVVVKQVRIKSDKDRRRMTEEYTIAKRLGRHENIVEMFALMPNCIDGNGQPCERLFMRYCNAGTLLNAIELHRKANVPLPENFIWYVFASLGYALARMHNGLNRETGRRSPDWTGYVHYDLKPDNIILNWSSDPARIKSQYPTPKLADFGCAGRIGRTPKWLGHCLYLSPEVSRDPWRPCMPECDIWALGLTIYEMMEFTPAFPQINTIDGLSLDLRKYRPMRSNYHPRLKTLVSRCLDLDYRRRPDAEKIFMETKRFKFDAERDPKGYRPWGYSKLLLQKPEV